MDCALVFVAPCFPCAHRAAQPIGVVHAAIEAWTMQNAACDFRQVEPTSVLGCGMDRQAVQQPSRFRRREGRGHGSPRMGVKVIEHQTHAGGLRRRPIYPCTDACGPGPFGPVCRTPHMTPSSQRFAPPTLMPPPLARICIVLAWDPTRMQRPGRVALAHPLVAGFVHPDDGMASIVGPLGDPQDVLHGIHTCGMGFGRNAPRLPLPQRESVFFQQSGKKLIHR